MIRRPSPSDLGEETAVEQPVIRVNLRSERQPIAEHRAEVRDHHGRDTPIVADPVTSTRTSKKSRRMMARNAARDPMMA